MAPGGGNDYQAVAPEAANDAGIVHPIKGVRNVSLNRV